jgi:hypothetical protein
LREAAGLGALEQAAVDQNEAAGALMSRGSPNDRAMAGFSWPTVDVSSEDGETEVSLAFSFDIGSTAPRKIDPAGDGPVFYKVTRSKLSLVASAPIDPDADLSSLFRGDSLIKGKKVKLAYMNLSNRLGNGAGALKFVPPAYEACVSTQTNEWLSQKGNEDKGPQARAFIAAAKANALEQHSGELEGSEYEVALENLAGQYGTLGTFVYQRCAPTGDDGHRYGDEAQLVAENSRFGSEFASRFYDERSTLLFWGFDASVGQEDYKYLDRALFDTPEVNKTSWEGGAYIGLVNWTATFSARLRGVYGRTWKLPEDGEACETVGDPPTGQCLTGPDGPPEKVDAGLVSLEARHLFKLDDTRTIALAPQITYNTEDDVVGVEVPVYLAPDKDGKLTGGLKFAWTSKDNEFGIGVFVGMPLTDLIPR